MMSIHIDSKNIKSVFYDGDRKELLIFFKSGSLYKYIDIDENTIYDFENSKNKTKFIKEKLINYRKVY